MKIYLASGAPGNEGHRERGMFPITHRLLSYWHIINKQFENYVIFNAIKNESK